MTLKIDSIGIDTFTHGMPSLIVDFRSNFNEISLVDSILIPDGVPYEIDVQTTDAGDITYIDIINFPAFLSNIINDRYLPDLGLFVFENSEPLPLKQIIFNFALSQSLQVA
jgi:hypothetical protein